MGFSPRLLIFVAAAAAAASAVTLSAQTKPAAPRPAATAAGARAFLADVNREMLGLANAASRASWVQSTYITPDTEQLAAQANEVLLNAVTRYAREASRFDKVTL